MSNEPGHLTLLERLDVALATRVALRRGDLDLGHPEELRAAPERVDLDADAQWVARALGLRGLTVCAEEAAAWLSSEELPPASSSQEDRLMFGMGTILRTIRQRGHEGKPPDGWGAVAMFRQLTADIPRFRANAIRRDAPWDGVLGVRYPGPDVIPSSLESFCEPKNYGEETDAFRDLHPVRRSVQLMWAFARIAPFPDFNGVMAFVLMNGYLLSKGYPMVTPQPEDREMLAQLVVGPRPQRVVQFESRLVEAIGA